MKSFKGQLVKTNVIMVVISILVVAVASFVLFFVYSVAGELYLLQSILLIALTGILTGAGCVAVSSELYGKVAKPLEAVRDAAENVAMGDLSFDVLTGADTEELQRLCEAVESIRRRLKESAANEVELEADRNMLIANLSHDMRTPVTTIKGYIEGINDGIANTPEKQKQYLDTIYAKTLVLERLLDNMSTYSEMELGRMQYVLEFVDIKAYMEDLAEEYGMDIEQAGLRFECELCGVPETVKGGELLVVADRGKLKRVLDNLISNAVKYNREDGTVRLSMETDGKGVFISVADTGMGISKADLPKIFEGFYRADAARTNIKGNGLGLAIAKQIVESHHGKLWAKSEENIGTQIFIYLPLRNRE